MTSSQNKPLVLLRGTQLVQRESKAEAKGFVSSDSFERKISDGLSAYGIPISAVQHCCGRGCKHCRVYWNKREP